MGKSSTIHIQVFHPRKHGVDRIATGERHTVYRPLRSRLSASSSACTSTGGSICVTGSSKTSAPSSLSFSARRAFCSAGRVNQTPTPRSGRLSNQLNRSPSVATWPMMTITGGLSLLAGVRVRLRLVARSESLSDRAMYSDARSQQAYQPVCHARSASYSQSGSRYSHVEDKRSGKWAKLTNSMS